jgi:hypothetical protein
MSTVTYFNFKMAITAILLMIVAVLVVGGDEYNSRRFRRLQLLNGTSTYNDSWMKTEKRTDRLRLGYIPHVSHHCHKHHIPSTDAPLVTLWQFHITHNTLHQLLKTSFNHPLDNIPKWNSIKLNFAFERTIYQKGVLNISGMYTSP